MKCAHENHPAGCAAARTTVQVSLLQRRRTFPKISLGKFSITYTYLMHSLTGALALTLAHTHSGP